MLLLLEPGAASGFACATGAAGGAAGGAAPGDGGVGEDEARGGAEPNTMVHVCSALNAWFAIELCTKMARMLGSSRTPTT